MEIERKFTIKGLPDNLDSYEKKSIEQGYLCTKPVVRIRKSNDDYYLTYKSKLNQNKMQDIAIKNDEVELPLTKDAYTHLLEKVDNNIIIKNRYIIPIEDNLKIELDIFEGKLNGLCFAEVEFPDEESAAKFMLPDWFLEDVSFDKRYSNSQLSKLDNLDSFYRL